VRYLLERGRTFNSAGEKDRARPLFVQAWEIAGAAGLEGLAVDAAHMVPIVVGGPRAPSGRGAASNLHAAPPTPRRGRCCRRC